jgi:hypothetical protein
MSFLAVTLKNCEISGSHDGEYEDDSLLGYCPDDGGSTHL